MREKQFLIVGGDIDGNLGDAAIARSLVDEIKRLDPSASIDLVSNLHPSCSPFGTNGLIPRGPRGFAALLARASRSNAIICGGGGLFQDDDSLVKMPYWALRLLVLRLFARRIIGFSIGAGPLNGCLSRATARLATAMLESVTVRDHLAQEVLQPSCSQPVGMTPDPAFMLTPTPGALADEVLRNANVPTDGRPLLGVAVRRCFNADRDLIPHQIRARLRFLKPRGERRMTRLRDNLVTALNAVIERTGAHLVFVPTYRCAVENDSQVCRQLAGALPTQNCTVLELSDPRLYKAITGKLDALLAGRMHPAILAAGMGTPSVSLAYNEKFRGTFDLLGQSHRCVDVEDLLGVTTPDRIAQLIIDALGDSAAKRQELKTRARHLGERTRRQLQASLAVPHHRQLELASS